MTREQFIEKIAPIVVKYAPQYNVLCPSAVIAQAVLESDGGMSELGQKAFNFFGLKYRPNRCPSACGIYYKIGSEQNTDGSYISSSMQWMKFANMDDGVKGYFDFTNISTYKSIKGISDPKTYLENIKKAGYATSLKYVDNLLAVINTYNLTRFDKKINDKEVSPLGYNITSSTYLNETIHGMKVNTSIKCSSTNYQTTSNRNVEYIVIHYTGNAKKDTAVNNAKYFQGTNRKASAHFFVDDTSIYQSVDLKDSAWHCGASNYRHARCRNINSVGIEMCCTAGNYTVSSKTQENTAYLCARLCKLFGISANEVDTYVLTHHSVTGKSCPKQYVMYPEQFVSFKNMVKDILIKGAVSSTTLSNPSSKVSYEHKGLDYSSVFNPTFYANRYGDLKKTYGTNESKLFEHFINFGMKEGRVASSTFNVQTYKSRYLDLKNTFGNNLPKYYEHWIKYGKKENRIAI